MTRVRSSLLLALALGCNSPGDRGAARRMPTKTPGPALGIPYIVGDPVPNPPARAVLARTPWISVLIGQRDGWLPETVDGPTPAALGALVAADRDPKTFAAVGRLVREHRRSPAGPALELERDELEAVGIAPPATHVWLFGPSGPCRAKVGAPYVGHRADAVAVWEVRWTLEDCPGSWAPVGSLAERLGPDLRWVPATDLVALETTADQPWDHPLADLATPPTWDGEYTTEIVWARTIEGASPKPVQVLWSFVRPSDPTGDEAPDPCAEERATAATSGFWSTGQLEPIEVPPEAWSTPVLLGAVVRDRTTVALVRADALDAWVSVPPVPVNPEDSEPTTAPQWPTTWTHVALARGLHLESARAFSAYRVVPDECMP